VSDSITMRRAGRSGSPDRADGDGRPGGGPRLRRAAPLLIVGVAVSGTSGSALAVRMFSVLGPVGTLWIRNLLAGLILVVIGWRHSAGPLWARACGWPRSAWRWRPVT
jgi:drug/metabolite transporter (DMT)-like permease